MLLATVLAAAAAATSPKPAPALPQGPVWELGRAAQAERRAVQADQFASVSTHSDAVGRQFKVELGPRSSGSDFSDLYYEGKLSMSLRPSVFYYDRATLGARISAIDLGSRVVSRSSHIGQNAFGVKANVTTSVSETISVAVVSMPRGDANALGAFSTRAELDSFKWEKEMPGPAAKAIFEGSKLVIEGEISAFPDGKVTKCDSTAFTATINSPVEGVTYTCYVASKIRRVAFIGGDGAILREWTTAAIATAPGGDVWQAKPAKADFERYFPERAQRLGRSGTVQLKCVAGLGGTLERCAVESEKPEDFGFADSALKLARLYRAMPDASVGSPLSLTIEFPAAAP